MAYFRYIAQLLHITDSSEFLKNITAEFKGTVTLIFGFDKEVLIGRSSLGEESLSCRFFIFTQPLKIIG
jgi:hypothetical protein